MIGATILSVTLVPVLCSLLIGGRVRGEEMARMRWIWGVLAAVLRREAD